MTTSTVILALAVFGASAVEMVEALTIVLAAGVTRGWRSAIEGTAAAVAVLAVLVLAVGVPLAHYVPINVLRVVIGALLLVLGLNWLRKAVLRASGHKALHDENQIYNKTVQQLSRPEGSSASRSGWRSGPRDATGFTVAFKGVFLEGMEVVLIVLTLGTSARHLGLAAAAAAAAVVIVGVAGLVVARQLSEVPENAMKMAVGIMLTSFGVFWVGEGSGIHWPGSDLFLLAMVAIFVSFAAAMTALMRRAARAGFVAPSAGERLGEAVGAERDGHVLVSTVARAVVAFGRFWWDFLVGDTPELFVATLVLVGLAIAFGHTSSLHSAGIPVVLVAVVAFLGLSTWRGRRRAEPPRR